MKPSRTLLILTGVVVLIVLTPVVITFIQALQGGAGSAIKAIRATSAIGLLRNTLLISAIATPLAGIIGVGSAWLVERTRLPGRRLWPLLLVAPLTIPLFITSYAWVAFDGALQSLTGAVGIVAFTYFPVVYLLTASALRGLDPALEDTARSLGSSPRQSFVRVIMPQLRPALLGALLLVLLDTLVEYDAFAALKIQTYSTNVVAQYRLSFSPSGAAALGMVSSLVCVVILLTESRLRGRRTYARVSHGARRAAVRYPLGRTMPFALLALTLVVAISVGIPVGELIAWFTSTNSRALSGASAGLSGLGSATVTSLWLSVAAAGVALLLALPIATLVVRYGGRLAAVLERATYLSFALPDLVAAIALSYGAVRWARFLYGGSVLLVLADAVLFVPFAVVALRASLAQLEPALEDSARALGAGPLTLLRRVTLPLVRPGVAAGGVLVFAFVLGDLSTATVLLPPSLNTLGTQFQADASTVAFGAAAPYAAVMIALGLLAAGVVMSSFGRVRGLRAQ